MEPDLGSFERRPSVYWFADGIPDLVIGGCLFLSGGLWLIGLNLPRHPLIWIPFWLVVPIVLTLLGLLENRILRRLKERITAPRTGHIELAGPSKRMKWIGRGIALVFGAAILHAVVTEKGLATLPVDAVLHYGAPGFMGVLFLLLGLGRRRYLILSAICFAWLAATWLRGLGIAGALGAYATVGFTMMVFGALRLRRYLQAHPRPEAAE